MQLQRYMIYFLSLIDTISLEVDTHPTQFNILIFAPFNKRCRVFSCPFSQAMSRGDVLSFLIRQNVQCYYVRFDYCLYIHREYWLRSLHKHLCLHYYWVKVALCYSDCFGMLYREDWLPLFDMNYSPLISVSCIVRYALSGLKKQKTRELFSSFLHKLNFASLLSNCCTSDIERTGVFFYTWIKLWSRFQLQLYCAFISLLRR